jgi:hypothetical protein
MSFLRDLSERIVMVTKDRRSFQFLLQRLSLAVQRGNAAVCWELFQLLMHWKNCFTFFRVYRLLFTLHKNVGFTFDKPVFMVTVALKSTGFSIVTVLRGFQNLISVAYSAQLCAEKEDREARDVPED